MINNKKKIFICCTEQSGENIAFNISKKLIKLNYQLDGVCGKKSEKFFTNKYYDISIFKSLGLFEILFSIPNFLRIINILKNNIFKQNYDLIICIDSPDFNYQLAKKLHKFHFTNPVIQIVAPTVWAWREGRAKKFSKVYDEIFTLFDFERKFFEKEGLRTTFIGHPISAISQSDEYNNSKNIISILPGSRENEVTKLYPYLKYIHDFILLNNKDKYKIFIPTLPHLKKKITKLTKNWEVETIISDNSKINEDLYKKVFISVTCSGTASLEIAKRLIPQIILYKLNFFTFFIFSFLIKIRYANIINILNNKMIIKEVINQDLSKDNLLSAFNTLLNDKKFRDDQIINVKKNLSEFDTSLNPYDVSVKRIKEIISTTN